MGLPIFSLLILFAFFYAAAIRMRRRGAYHKRLMLLASAAALSAATFRIFLRIFGVEQWVWVVGFSTPILFIVAAMIYDYRQERNIHPVYRWGVPAMIGLVGVAFLLVMVPAGEGVQQGLAWVARVLGPLY